MASVDLDRYAEIYRLAEPYWQTRSNEIHVPESYELAVELVEAHPEANPDLVLPAILLHDTGYMAVSPDEQLKGLAGSAAGWEPDVTRRHEIAGAALAGEILASVGWDPDLIETIQDIVDGHDSRTEAVSIEDALVKDADKLWRYTESAARICCSWIDKTPREFLDWTESEMDRWLFTATARDIARRELDRSRAALTAGPVR